MARCGQPSGYVINGPPLFVKGEQHLDPCPECYNRVPSKNADRPSGRFCCRINNVKMSDDGSANAVPKVFEFRYGTVPLIVGLAHMGGGDMRAIALLDF